MNADVQVLHKKISCALENTPGILGMSPDIQKRQTPGFKKMRIGIQGRIYCDPDTEHGQFVLLCRLLTSFHPAAFGSASSVRFSVDRM
jgi:hypothetical protein